MEHLPNRENTNFPLAVHNAAKELPRSDKFLLYHQTIPVEYFTSYPKARGILMMHETGSGKSITAIAMADRFRKTGRRPIVIVPKTLQNNFKDNIVKYKMQNDNIHTKEMAGEAAASEYSYVSANANNMIAQLRRVSQTNDIQSIFNDNENGEPENDNEPISLEGTIVIVDEAHNLFNGIISGSSNARALYDVIMHARDVKIVFLTSTVIINTPFEIVPCFNMITGKNILPVNYIDFMNMFVDDKNDKIKNTEHLKARIFGLTAYFGSWYETGGILNIHSSIIRDGMPTRLGIKEEFVKMSVKQYGIYTSARDNEMRQKSYPKSNVQSLSKPKSDAGSTYRIHSRQYSNFWLQHGEELTVDHLRDIESRSPKFAAVLNNIKKHGDDHGIVYSSFVNTHGIMWFAKLLELNGYVKFQPDGYGSSDGDNKKRYAFITGDMTINERSDVLHYFNSEANKDGSLIHLILGSPAMSEGIDIHRARHVHIMEAPWHFSSIEQIIARAVRYGSHADLPEKDRVVQPYIYLSDYPDDIEKIPEPTTDVMLYYKSIKKTLMNNQFIKALIEVSIDCGVHMENASDIAKKNIHCMLCVPDNKPLFDSNFAAHLRKPLACRQTISRNITVEEIKYGGRTFYFSKDESGSILLYEYNKNISSYIQLQPSSKWYAPLFKKLTS